MPKSQLDWLGVAGLWIGALVMAIKAGGLPLMTGAPSWLASNVWGYVPAILVSFYIIVALYRLKQTPTTVAEQPTPALPKVAPRAAPARRTTKRGTKGRTFLSSDITPDYLMDMCDDKTSAHAAKAMEPYIGKWYHYAGVVRNVIVMGDTVQIRFESGSFRAIKAQVCGELELADVLHKGDNIEIVGRISEIDVVTFALKEAEVVAR